MNQPTHRERAEQLLQRAATQLETMSDTDEEFPAFAGVIGTGFAVLAHLDALALPEPGVGDEILAAARKLTDELDAVQDHDHGNVTSGPDDHAQRVVPGADVARVATNAPSSVSPDAGNGSGELRADLEALIVDTAGCVWNRPPMEVADAIIAAGWRPPLPDGGQDLAEHAGRAIVEGLSAHSWPGGDHSNASLSDIGEAVLEAVMPFLDEPLPDEIAVIAAERRRVVDIEGRTPEHDDGHVHGQLVYAAAAYLGETVGAPAYMRPGQLWPWNYQGFKPGDGLANLVKAGQFVAAEIARLQRTRARAERGQSTPDTDHVDDCTGCDGPGIVPCAADRVIGNTAFRDGQPIKDLEAGRG